MLFISTKGMFFKYYCFVLQILQEDGRNYLQQQFITRAKFVKCDLSSITQLEGRSARFYKTALPYIYTM